MAVRSGRTPSSPCSSTSAWRTTTSWPGAWSRTWSRTQPTRFCPKSTRVAPDGEEKTAVAGRVWVTRTGGPSGATRRARSASTTSTASGAVAAPGTQVGPLAVIEVVGQDPALAGHPRGVGAQADDLPIRGRHLELGEQGQPVAVMGMTAVPAQPAPIPAVAEQHLQVVAALTDQPGDVVGLVPQPVAVAGPSRGQDLVADATPVQGGLVQAVGGGVQPRPHDPTGQVEGSTGARAPAHPASPTRAG